MFEENIHECKKDTLSKVYLKVISIMSYHNFSILPIKIPSDT